MDKQPTGMLNDLYQLTMSQGYWQKNMGDLRANFHLFIRQNPFGGGFSLFAGLENLIANIQNFSFAEDDLAYLSTLKQKNGDALFQSEFLKFLKDYRLDLDLWSLQEGCVFFPQCPILRVEGPIIACQLLETMLLNTINFQTLIATKAARIYLSADGADVLEFGFRRAQGVDGALSASRAAYIGGCSSTSNLYAGKTYGIPVSGSHAHSWVLAFGSEIEAFEAYASVYPNQLILLVDTYDTLQGIENAIKVAQNLPNPSEQLLAIRLDSGDLTYLSTLARQKLDQAGFTKTKILASNDLDEQLVENLKFQKAKIDVWGVGTKLVSADGYSSLKGVYKLTAIQAKNGQWIPKLKISNDQSKINHPGLLQVRRFFDAHQKFLGDAIYALDLPEPKQWRILNPMNPMSGKKFSSALPSKNLLELVFQKGKRISVSPNIQQMRENSIKNLQSLDPTLKRILNPHIYPVGLEVSTFERKMAMIAHLKSTEG